MSRKLTMILVTFIVSSLVIGLIGYGVTQLTIETFQTLFGVATGALVLYILIAAYAILMIQVSPRHGDEAKITWIIIILVIPVFGLMFYALFGAKYKAASKAKLRRFQYDSYANFETKLLPPVATLSEGKYAKIPDYIRSLTGRPVYDRTSIKFYNDGVEYMNAMIKGIDSAKEHINMEFYIWEDSEFATNLKRALLDASRRGVKIRILVDGLGVMKLSNAYIKELKNSGIRFEIFHKIRFFLFTPNDNFRTHRKICVIDGKVAFTGGINIGNEYIHKNPKYGYWGDCGIKVEGNAVKSLQLIFMENWTATTREKFDFKTGNWINIDSSHKEGMGYVQVVEDGPTTFEAVHKDILVKAIMMAKKRIWITTPYLVPTNDLMSALTVAARSGVDVRIITPGKPDKKSVFRVTRSFYEQLIDSGVKIYEFHKDGAPRFMHSKTYIIDDVMGAVGTSNIDLRSFRLNFEVMTYIYDGPVLEDINKYYEMILLESKRVDENYMIAHNIHKGKVITAVLRSLGPLM